VKIEQKKKITYNRKELSWKNRDADVEKAIKTSSNAIESVQIGEAYPDSNKKITNQIQNNETILILQRSN
jgi:hypothetical protein